MHKSSINNIIILYHISGSCLSRLYVMAFTSDLSGASSDTSYSIQLQYNGAVKTMALYDRPGDDYMSNSGDFWELSLSGWQCIKIRDLQRVSIIANGNDGWNIESIVTLVSDSSNIQVLTQNFDVNRWIDGDGPSSQRQFDLTLPGKYHIIHFSHGMESPCSFCALIIKFCYLYIAAS